MGSDVISGGGREVKKEREVANGIHKGSLDAEMYDFTLLTPNTPGFDFASLEK